MPQIARDEEREERIRMEIIVDAYGPDKQATAWYVYLQEQLQFPVLTHCIAERAISPLQIGDEVEIIDMAPEAECEHEMFVMMRWERRGLAVPLSQLEVFGGIDEQTQQAIEDWHYWVKRGYRFS